MATTSANKSKSQPTNPIALTYLVAYNVAQIMGWSAILLASLSHFITERTQYGLFDKIANLLYVFQTAAVLEILHSAVGLVRSNVVLTAFQVYSRVFLVWGVVYTVPYVHNGVPLLLFVFAWTITEIIRYSFYFGTLVGNVPFVLQWCRYSFFILLYPIGVIGELWTILDSLTYVQRFKVYSFDLPNVMNMSFSYYYFLIFTMLSYIPVFPQLYCHMLVLRRKSLGLTTEVRPKRD